MRAACLLGFCALAALAQAPQIENAKQETRSAAAGLEPALRTILAQQSAPAWVAWAAPVIPGDRHMCCSNSSGCCGGCRLEGGAGVVSGAQTGPIRLEGPKEFFVFLRVESRQVQKVRTFSPGCAIDAGGLPFIWLTDVQPAQSVAYLATLVEDSDRLGNSATAAIAFHAAPEAVKTLIRIAHDSPRARVRGQALFWLAQTAERQISEQEIAAAIEKDPETEVKRRAVFALTQIPHGDGVPKLIEVARTNRNAAVRKQAMFWLGQSKDPRALKFFEGLFTR